MAGGTGATVNPPETPRPRTRFSIGEDQGRYVIAGELGRRRDLAAAKQAGVPARAAGLLRRLRRWSVEGLISLPLTDIKAAHEAWLPGYMAATDNAGNSSHADGRRRDRSRLIKEGIPGRRGRDPGSRRRRRPLCRHGRFTGLRRQIQDPAAPDGLWRAGWSHGRRAACAKLTTMAQRPWAPYIQARPAPPRLRADWRLRRST